MIGDNKSRAIKLHTQHIGQVVGLTEGGQWELNEQHTSPHQTINERRVHLRLLLQVEEGSIM